MMVGDGLSKIRVKTFVNMIQKNCYNMNDKNNTVNIMSEALKQVVHTSGDLHSGLFHFLNDTHSLFFTCLIQPMQKMLG